MCFVRAAIGEPAPPPGRPPIPSAAVRAVAPVGAAADHERADQDDRQRQPRKPTPHRATACCSTRAITPSNACAVTAPMNLATTIPLGATTYVSGGPRTPQSSALRADVS